MKIAAKGTSMKVASALLTVLFLAGGVAIGGGIPLSLSDLAGRTAEAADNARAAARNTESAAEDTEALAGIAESVKSQLDSSRRMVATQSKIEHATDTNVRSSRQLTAVIKRIRSALDELVAGLTRVSKFATASGATAESSAAAAGRLDATLTALSERFEVVVAQSRELNRKANAYAEITP